MSKNVEALLTEIDKHNEKELPGLYKALWLVLPELQQKIIRAIAVREETGVSQLCEDLRLPQGTISGQLVKLKIFRLVESQKLKKEVIYSIPRSKRVPLSIAAQESEL